MGSFSRPPSVWLRPAVSSVSLVILAAGVAFVLRAATGNNTIIDSWQDPNSKQVAAMTSSGTLSLSGRLLATSVLIDGVSINTGTLVTQSQGDSRYVNVSGDTMTGALTLDIATENTTVLSISGAFIFNDAGLNNDVRWESLDRNNMLWLDADENSLAVNTTETGGTLTVSGSLALNVKAFSGSITLDKTHSVVLIDASGKSPSIITLPKCSQVYDRTYVIKKIDDSSNILQINAAAGDRIDASGSHLLQFQYDSLSIICSRYKTGTGWFIW